MNPEIARCRREQARCREHILSGKPDAFLAWLGLQDWFREELIILEEEYQSQNRLDRFAFDLNDGNRNSTGRRETQQSIADWASATFGPARSLGVIAARANREMAELLSETAAVGNNPPTSVECDRIAEECADVLIPLLRLAHVCNFDLLEQVDRKMAINRGREWVLRGDGTGSHHK